MSQPFGNPCGPLYPLGAIVVTTPGTSVLLNQNVPITTAFGTAGSPAPVVATQLILTATGTGLTYLVFKGGSGTVSSSVIVALAPGQTYTLASPQLSNPFQLTNLAVDAATAANSLYITAVIV